MKAETQITLEDVPAWAMCPARRGQPGATVRRTVAASFAASFAASAVVGVSAAGWMRLGGHAAPVWDPFAAAAFSGGAIVSASCLSPHWPGVRRRLPPGRAVALTFDDGPAPGTTPRILDALAADGAVATFFVLGAEAKRHPGLIDEIVARGHAIGVHGWDHRPMTWTRPSDAIDLLRRARDVVEDRAGRPVFLYRPPWGHRGPALRLALARLRWRNIGWRLAGGDWRANSPNDVVARLGAHIRPRDIVLLHDAGPGADITAAALPRILGDLARRSFALRPVPVA